VVYVVSHLRGKKKKKRKMGDNVRQKKGRASLPRIRVTKGGEGKKVSLLQKAKGGGGKKKPLSNQKKGKKKKRKKGKWKEGWSHN